MADTMEALGKLADDVDNLIHAMQLPLPPHLHLAALKESLPRIRDGMRYIVVTETGDDPWA